MVVLYSVAMAHSQLQPLHHAALKRASSYRDLDKL